MAHDKITTQNGRVIRIEWEQYVGGGGYVEWSAAISDRGEQPTLSLSRKYDGQPCVGFSFRASDLAELNEKLAILMEKPR